eukprot:5609148-Heterocapsa_arctica.AAC.1
MYRCRLAAGLHARQAAATKQRWPRTAEGAGAASSPAGLSHPHRGPVTSRCSLWRSCRTQRQR